MIPVSYHRPGAIFDRPRRTEALCIHPVLHQECASQATAAPEDAAVVQEQRAIIDKQEQIIRGLAALLVLLLAEGTSKHLICLVHIG